MLLNASLFSILRCQDGCPDVRLRINPGIIQEELFMLQTFESVHLNNTLSIKSAGLSN